MSTNIIYGLIDPRNGQLRYVGASSRGLKRPKNHWRLTSLKIDKTHKGNWIRQLLTSGVVPEVITIESLSSAAHLDEAEIFWIGYFRMIGANLTNMTNGGAGAYGCKRSDSHKERIRSVHTGKTLSEYTKQLLRDANVGKKYGQQYKANMSLTTGGKGIIVDQFGNEFISQHEAAKFHNVASGNISKVLRGIGRALRGVTFSYKDQK